MTVTENANIGRTPGRLRVLVYTTLFPNSVHPLQGNFVLERMRHLQPFVDMSVVAPVPYFPRVRLNQRWYQFASVPRSETFAGFNVDHPRYVVLPKLGMTTHGVSMFTGSFRRVCARLRASDYDLIDGGITTVNKNHERHAIFAVPQFDMKAPVESTCPVAGS